MRGYVGPEGSQVHYRMAGSTGPVLVLLHESPQASNVFELALPELGWTMRAYAFDTPGYGQSDPPSDPLEIAGYAELLLSAIDELGIDEFAVYGQHTGASIALEIARLAGARVNKAILSGLALLSPETRASFLADWAPDKAPKADGSHFNDLWEKYIGLWESPPELLNLSVTNIASVLDRYNWAYNAAFRHDPAGPLASIEASLLLFTARRDMLAYCDAEALRIRPDAKQVQLTDTTGQLAWREPREFAAVVHSFLSDS